MNYVLRNATWICTSCSLPCFSMISGNYPEGKVIQNKEPIAILQRECLINITKPSDWKFWKYTEYIDIEKKPKIRRTINMRG
jgi:hypothetical protein